MARLDDEYQDLEEVTICYIISNSAMMCLKPANIANGGCMRSIIVLVLLRCAVVVELLLTKAIF